MTNLARNPFTKTFSPSWKYDIFQLSADKTVQLNNLPYYDPSNPSRVYSMADYSELSEEFGSGIAGSGNFKIDYFPNIAYTEISTVEGTGKAYLNGTIGEWYIVKYREIGSNRLVKDIRPMAENSAIYKDKFVESASPIVNQIPYSIALGGDNKLHIGCQSDNYVLSYSGISTQIPISIIGFTNGRSLFYGEYNGNYFYSTTTGSVYGGVDFRPSGYSIIYIYSYIQVGQYVYYIGTNIPFGDLKLYKVKLQSGSIGVELFDFGFNYWENGVIGYYNGKLYIFGNTYTGYVGDYIIIDIITFDFSYQSTGLNLKLINGGIVFRKSPKGDKPIIFMVDSEFLNYPIGTWKLFFYDLNDNTYGHVNTEEKTGLGSTISGQNEYLSKNCVAVGNYFFIPMVQNSSSPYFSFLWRVKIPTFPYISVSGENNINQ